MSSPLGIFSHAIEPLPGGESLLADLMTRWGAPVAQRHAAPRILLASFAAQPLRKLAGAGGAEKALRACKGENASRRAYSALIGLWSGARRGQPAGEAIGREREPALGAGLG